MLFYVGVELELTVLLLLLILKVTPKRRDMKELHQSTLSNNIWFITKHYRC